MVLSLAAKDLRAVGWNGLRFDCPRCWEVIVAGPHHLLLEQVLSPILEIRWEQAEKKHSIDNVVYAANRQLNNNETSARQITLPQQLLASGLPDLTGLTWHNNEQLDGLVWKCRTCDTVIFCHLSNHQKACLSTVALLLQSLRCHHDGDEESLWSVQDFRLTLPVDFAFVNSSFAAGLSRLAFAGHDLDLQFCRLAPASTRIAIQSLSQLLADMLGPVHSREVITDTAKQYEVQTIPAAPRRLLPSFVRKPVFSWGRIWHDTGHNRLLSIVAHSKRPIPLTTVHHLASRYEILPLQ